MSGWLGGWMDEGREGEKERNTDYSLGDRQYPNSWSVS